MKKRVRAIIIENGKVLLIHRIRKDTDYWVFPGGGVDENDKDEISALKRECMEELGVEIADEKFISSEFITLSGKREKHIFYASRIVGGTVGTGRGPEYDGSGRYEGSHVPAWIPLEKLEGEDVRPQSVKKMVLKIHRKR